MTVAVIAVSVYLILLLIQLKRTAEEMHGTLARVNKELDAVSKVSGKIVNFTERLTSPLVSAGTVIYYIFSFLKKKKDK